MPLTPTPVITTSWIHSALDRLAGTPCGYHSQEPSAAEPTALAALALLGAGRTADAQTHLRWLAAAQASDGSIAPFSELTQSAWPTPQAIFAAAVAARAELNLNDARPDTSLPASPSNVSQLNHSPFNLQWATQWLLSAAGKSVENSPDFGHNGQLIGWPWVIGTHSWQEPTAWSVLALKAVGQSDHPRTREGVRLLVDRLLSTGGCNYGNTIVLGQQLRPHVEPTGLALLALAGEEIDDLRIERSLQYLLENLSIETTPISLSYGLLGLAAHDRQPAAGSDWIESAYHRTVQRDAAPLVLALLVLAAQGKDCPLIKYTSGKHTSI
ncbi:MAG TPA: hypothetical protein VMJ32_06680 [Pirellulales bacterium]|nr:hypothetical protein [Pirellulales bacterium]